MTANFSYFLMALVALLIFPAVLSRQDFGWYRIFVVDLPLFMAATGVVSRFYIHSQKEIYADWKTRLKYMPFVLAFGMGISLNNARAVLEALVGRETEFRRTPKYRVVDQLDTWRGKRYIVPRKSAFLSGGGRGALFLLGHRVFGVPRDLFPRSFFWSCSVLASSTWAGCPFFRGSWSGFASGLQRWKPQRQIERR